MSLASNEKFPRVGVAVFVRKGGKILMGLRQGAHGSNTWALPGGKLDFGERVEDCARREVMEETTISIHNLRPGPFTNDIFEESGLHFVTLFWVSDYHAGEPLRVEPQKCLEWRWVDWNHLPRPLFLPLENLLKTSFDPFLD